VYVFTDIVTVPVCVAPGPLEVRSTEFVEIVAKTPGEHVSFRSTFPENPLRLVRVTVEVSDGPPGVSVRVSGVDVMLKSFPGTSTVIVVESSSAPVPFEPVTVTKYAPGAVVEATETSRVEVPFVDGFIVTDEDESLGVTSEDEEESVRLTAPLNPCRLCTLIIEELVPPARTVKV
jgi:hypothetical protein